MVLGMVVKKPDSSGGDSYSIVDDLKPLRHRLMKLSLKTFVYACVCICVYIAESLA